MNSFGSRWEWFRQHVFRRVLWKHRVWCRWLFSVWYVHMNLNSMHGLKMKKAFRMFILCLKFDDFESQIQMWIPLYFNYFVYRLDYFLNCVVIFSQGTDNDMPSGFLFEGKESPSPPETSLQTPLSAQMTGSAVGYQDHPLSGKLSQGTTCTCHVRFLSSKISLFLNLNSFELRSDCEYLEGEQRWQQTKHK